MKNFGIFLLVSLAYIASVSEAQFSRNEPGYRPGFFQQNPCVSKQTCSKCLQTPNCAWCMKDDYTSKYGSPLPRCNNKRAYFASLPTTRLRLDLVQCCFTEKKTI